LAAWLCFRIRSFRRRQVAGETYRRQAKR
jgi:hypothetical protein